MHIDVSIMGRRLEDLVLDDAAVCRYDCRPGQDFLVSLVRNQLAHVHLQVAVLPRPVLVADALALLEDLRVGHVSGQILGEEAGLGHADSSI